MISDMKTLFILNPAAQHGECAKLTPVLKRLATARNLDFEIAQTTHAGNAREIAEGAKAFDLVISVGGDGTTHEIVNGLMKIAEDERPVYTALPCGSGSDFCRTIAMPLDFTIAFEEVMNGRIVTCDLGICNGEYYAYSASIGLDAEIATKAIELSSTTNLSGNPLYMRAASICIFKNYKHRHLSYTIDDGDTQEQDLLMFCVNNGIYYGGGTKVAPSAALDDGLLNYCFAENMPAAKAAASLGTMLLGKHEKLSKVHVGTGKKFVIDCDESICGQLDGEPMWTTHYEFSIEPATIRYVVPNNSWVGKTDTSSESDCDTSDFDGIKDAGDCFEELRSHASEEELQDYAETFAAQNSAGGASQEE